MQASIDLRQQVINLASELAAAGIENPRSEAWLLFEIATRRRRAELVSGAVDALSSAERQRLEGLAARRLQREPMAHLAGMREFWSLPFEVGPAVLVPRPDSETVIEAALAQIGNRDAARQILDLGTGSGCLLLSLLSELPAARGLGVDRSAAALAVARRNAEQLGLTGRAEFLESNWGADVTGRFDLIVANPPYVRTGDWDELAPEIRAFEPKEALLAGPDGLAAYRALAPDLARLLEQDGVACLEIGQGQGPTVSEILQRHRLRLVGSRGDLAGIERCLVLRRD